MKDIIERLLSTTLGYAIDERSLDDLELFEEKFGKAISMELMCLIFNAMRDAKKNGDGVQEFKISLVLEKSNSFPVIKGEFIG